MDTDESLEMVIEIKGSYWWYGLQQRESRMPGWVTRFHPQKLACEFEGAWIRGSFNVARKVVFTSREAWMVRFPMNGKASTALLEKKVAQEVAALRLIRENTDIPVPEVKAWGLAKDNSLGLGPFIIEEFVEGESLKKCLCKPGSGLLSDGIEDERVEDIYRQLARFMLQLFKLNFSQIGPLPAESESTSRPQPLTIKAHEIYRLGGIDVFGSPSNKGYSTTTEYFRYVIGQDFLQLLKQWSSTDDENDAREKYIFFCVVKRLIDRHIWPEYDRGPFKLICDDFGLGNTIIDSTENLNIIGVVDLEWSYIGPAQMLGTAPWWLLVERPTVWGIEPDRGPRFFKHLSTFKRQLEQEEAALPDHEKLSPLVERSEKSGTMWFHMLLQGFWNDPNTFVSKQLRAATPDWDELVAEIPEEEIQSFVVTKMTHLRQDRERQRYTKGKLDEMIAGKCTIPEFLSHIEEELYGRTEGGGYKGMVEGVDGLHF